MVALGPLSSQPVLGTCRSSPAANRKSGGERVRVAGPEEAEALATGCRGLIDHHPPLGVPGCRGRGQARELVPFLSSSFRQGISTEITSHACGRRNSICLELSLPSASSQENSFSPGPPPLLHPSPQKKKLGDHL